MSKLSLQWYGNFYRSRMSFVDVTCLCHLTEKKKVKLVKLVIIERVNIALYPHKVGIHISAALISLLKEWIELHIDGIS